MVEIHTNEKKDEVIAETLAFGKLTSNPSDSAGGLFSALRGLFL
jgi:hypothetical protein